MTYRHPGNEGSSFSASQVFLFSNNIVTIFHCVRVRLGTSHFRHQLCKGKTHRNQHIILFRAMLYYNKRVPRKMNKRKSWWGKVWRKPGSSSSESSLSRVTQDTLNSSNSELWQAFEMLKWGRLSVQNFTEGWLCKHLLSLTYQNFRCPEGKQLFSINNIF